MKCAVWTINLQLTWSLFFPWLTDTTESFERLCLVAALQSFQEGESKNFPLANIDIWICCKSKFWLAYTVSYTTGVASHYLGSSLSQFVPQKSLGKTVVELIKRKFFQSVVEQVSSVGKIIGKPHLKSDTEVSFLYISFHVQDLSFQTLLWRKVSIFCP